MRKENLKVITNQEPVAEDIESLFWQTKRLIKTFPQKYGLQINTGQYIEQPGDLTEEVVRQALSGEITVDLKGEERNRFITLDIDVKSEYLSNSKTPTEKQLKVAESYCAEVQQKLNLLSVKYLAETSGRRGFHIWLFFGEPQAVADLVTIASWLIVDIKKPKEIDIEIKPSRAGDGIRLFGTINRKTGQRSEFIYQDPNEDRATYLAKVEINTNEEFEDLLEAANSAKDIKECHQCCDLDLDINGLHQCKSCDSILNKIGSGKLGHKERLALGLLVSSAKSEHLEEQFVELFKSLSNFSEDITKNNLQSLKKDKPLGCKKISSMLGLCSGTCDISEKFSIKTPAALFNKNIAQDNSLIPEQFRIFKGYKITTSGIQKLVESEMGSKWLSISGTPTWIKERTEYLDDESVGVTLNVLDGKNIKEFFAPMTAIADTKHLINLADKGFNVNTLTAKDCIAFYDAMYNKFKSTLPNRYLSRASGWVEFNGKRGFILGKKTYLPDLSETALLAFGGEDEPSRVLKKSLGVCGDLETWLKTIKPLLKYRYFVLALGLAFASALLELVRIGNLLVHFYGESSGGKSTLLMLAMSVYGYGGDSSKQNSLIKSWKSRLVGLEGVAYAYNALPLPIDESGEANPNILEQAIYMLGNGGNPSRGSPSGEGRKQKNWNNMVISSGEGLLLPTSAKTGQEVRTIEINNPPFDEDGINANKNKEVVDNLQQVVQENYGHAGDVYLKELVAIANDPEKLNEFRTNFKEKENELSKMASNNFHERNAKHFAAIWLGLEVADRLLGVAFQAQ